jgi:predicted deacylase
MIRRSITGVILAAALAGCAYAQTTFTGDRIDGAPVISRLDVEDLRPSALHLFYMRPGDQSIGQGWYVPVMVLKGANPGPRLMIVAASHGDELNGLRVIHRLMNEINPDTLSGVLIGAPGLNPSGMLADNRQFITSNDGGGGFNLNRVFPGDPDRDDFGTAYAGRLWRDLLRPNADLAIDLHTQTRGTVYPMYVFADATRPASLRIAELLAPDMLKYDPGQAGTLETAFNEAGVPAVTLELGAPKTFNPVMIERAVRGIRNVMIDRDMIPGPIDLGGIKTYVGGRAVSVRATRGGISEVLVQLGASVTVGQVVARQRDPFGRVIATYTAPVTGRVVSLGDDPLRETGGLLVRILVPPDADCLKGC